MKRRLPGSRVSLQHLVRTRAAELSPDLENWLCAGVAAGIAFPSRIPPRGGLFGQRLGRLQLTLRLRNGYRLRCRLDELEGYYAAFVNREYEGAVSDWNGVQSVIDVGANVGAATLWFARSAPRAKILSVEPSHEVFSRLVANIERSGLKSRVTPMAVALGSAAGLTRVEIHPWSVVTKTGRHDLAGAPVVGQVTLEQLLDASGFNRLDVLKLDCEGAEYDGLLAAPESVLRAIDTIVAECHPVPGHNLSELENHLRRAGFAVFVTEKLGQAGMLHAVPRSR